MTIAKRCNRICEPFVEVGIDERLGEHPLRRDLDILSARPSQRRRRMQFSETDVVDGGPDRGDRRLRRFAPPGPKNRRTRRSAIIAMKSKSISPSWKELRRRNCVMQTRDYSCGAAALATVLRYYWGGRVGEEDILQALFKTLTAEERKDRYKNGLAISDLRRVAVDMGYLSTIGTSRCNSCRKPAPGGRRHQDSKRSTTSSSFAGCATAESTLPIRSAATCGRRSPNSMGNGSRTRSSSSSSRA